MYGTVIDLVRSPYIGAVQVEEAAVSRRILGRRLL